MHNFLVLAIILENHPFYFSEKEDPICEANLNQVKTFCYMFESKIDFIELLVYALAFFNGLDTFFIEEKLKKFQEIIMFCVLSNENTHEFRP